MFLADEIQRRSQVDALRILKVTEEVGSKTRVVEGTVSFSR